MAPEQLTGQRAAYGEAPRQWEQALLDALDLRDHVLLKQTLALLRAELGSQARLLDRMDRAPVLDHLVEHARRLLRSAPTQQEALERELAEERRLWAAFRERYREHFVPVCPADSLRFEPESSVHPSCPGRLRLPGLAPESGTGIKKRAVAAACG